MARRLVFAFLAIIVASGFVFAVSPNALAVTAADWRAGNIIDDSLFYDNTSMTVDEIQSFLNSKNPSCDTWGTQPATEKGYPNLTHAQYAARVGWPAPPYICLKDYYQTPRSDVIESNFNSTATKPAGSISAATIIKNAADTYGVSPKALLVLLHKESAGPLTVDTWPLLSQYKNAMGYACPDTAPCDPQHAGFYNQMTNAAKRIQTYKKYPNSYRHKPFALNSTVYYNPRLAAVPDGGCGWSSVYISGYATAGLYNYTPYQPNQAALDNLYGIGDDCSAYGNRNFWRVWNDWFGPTVNKYVAFDTPRWMVLNQNTNKVTPQSGVATSDPTLTDGTQLRFVDKIYENGKWYYRTEWDRNNGQNKGIDASAVSDIQYVSLDNPRYMTTSSIATKIAPAANRASQYTFQQGTYTLFSSKINIKGQWYFRTAYDTERNNNLAFHSDNVSDATFLEAENPRYMRATIDAEFKDLSTNTTVSLLTVGNDYYITDKVLLNGEWYFRIKDDKLANKSVAVSHTAFTNINFEKIPAPYSVINGNEITKYDPYAEKAIPNSLIVANSIFRVYGFATIGNTQYYLTEYDYTNNTLDRAVKVSDTRPHTLSYMPLENPRPIASKESTPKVDLKTGTPTDTLLDPSRPINYATKTQIAGIWYLRTEYDTTRNNDLGVPIELLNL